ncbi:transporter substrate-binding domain-containing protein [Pseudomonas aeruginosa]|uniref:transporter substrate-binding domain-containing protein n=1 Tax=Pseudomonas aeruginosa TaxID=287 RepID=UPI003B52A644
MERHPRRPAERQVRHRAEPGLGERAAAQGLRLQRAIHHLQRPVDRARRRNPPVQVAGRPQGPQARRRPGHQLRRPGEVGGRRQRAHLSGRPGIPAGPGQQTHRRGAQRPPADPLRHPRGQAAGQARRGVGPVANMAIPYRKNNPKFGEALNAALEKIKADGRFAKLSEKWFGLDVSQPPK